MKYSICMVSDFFYPNSGGVEAHVFQLSQCLLAMGHKVIVVTHSYGSRVGIRYMTSGLKVYYCPYKTFYKGCVLPTMLTTLPLLRNIFIREQVDIVHGHSAFSTLAHEAMLHAGSMGIRTVFTDHSLFGFADTSAIVTNNFLQVSLAQVDHCICVSYTGKENTVLRANVTSHRVSVIPNAVDSAAFTPDPSRRSSDRITVVMVSRLVYRKGADLLAGLIPLACRKHDKLHFLIGGDGPKRSMLEEMTEKNQLSDRVTFLGELKHSEVRDVLVQGDIYINCSLTEAFCIAIVEAASCGLQVVSTRVGGVPEVLPPDQIWLTEPTVESLLSGLDAAVAEAGRPSALSAWDRHRRVASMYRWQEVAARTQDVYDIVWRTPRRDQRSQTMRYLSSGPLSGKFMIAVLFLLRLYSAFLEWFQPREDIELAADWHRGFRSANQPLQH
ncbi:phosphatidylinositol N-acetylglucosaminyltransferase subunit A-like [Amphibalanus amphitrite]|uniref:phosphatidylinositol N-acetylglucosaminyltransferase subunit A-like n=1 Tax=Amphibalanus amphitrite TaxID=1232801 RepID=UPI001C904A66|nr:phosphatidylinositol N-acetylglucosaminyltransferase subunit A-like [Amphibalanus amphitrite]XP_043198498.1 phosphatidylinositol N-acetylglucosaminyltransferase subunit A-like [Amphibalanus amphitrite]